MQYSVLTHACSTVSTSGMAWVAQLVIFLIIKIGMIKLGPGPIIYCYLKLRGQGSFCLRWYNNSIHTVDCTYYVVGWV